MKDFLKECVLTIHGVATGPVEHLGRDAWHGFLNVVTFVLAFLLSLLILATFPVSIPLLVCLDRRNRRKREERRAAFAKKVLESIHQNGASAQ